LAAAARSFAAVCAGWIEAAAAACADRVPSAVAPAASFLPQKVHREWGESNRLHSVDDHYQPSSSDAALGPQVDRQIFSLSA
jgi:hypothetical protein